MLPTKINGHSPMDDYQKMLQQADFFIENAEVNLLVGNRKRLEQSAVYKILFTAVKILFIISGISLVFSVITFNIGKNNTTRLILMYSVFVTVGTFGLALIICCIAGYMETHSDKKDRKARVIQNSETWVLTNGCIAVVADKGDGRAYQMVKHLVMDKNHFVIVPFSRMDIIHKVHSIQMKNGKITADVNATEYYITHPYVNEYPDDEDLSRYFHYYRKRVRRKIDWSENILGIDKLIKALNSLKN